VVHWKSKHPPCMTKHQGSCGIISQQHETNFVFFPREAYKMQDGLAHLQSCWWCSNSLLVWCAMQNFQLCGKKKTRHCCQCLLASSWPSKYKCSIMPRCEGHCIYGIHLPPGKNVHCTNPNFIMAVMWLPLWKTRHCLEACHENFQDSSSKHWGWFNC
jgi:hypothetical protein